MPNHSLRPVVIAALAGLLSLNCRNTRQNTELAHTVANTTSTAGATSDSAANVQPSHNAANSAANVEHPAGTHPGSTLLPTAQVIAVQFGTALGEPLLAGVETATFAGGCFWCTESSFEHVRGVRAVVSGYTGGAELRPTYQQVCDHETGHAEAVRVVFDPTIVSYAQLLDVFWRLHDPTTPDQSFHDFGHQYRSAIYVHNAAQREAVEQSKRALESAHRYARPIVTEIANVSAFWPAEDYHQDYYLTHPDRYMSYRTGSGRDAYSDEVWGAGALARAQQH
jgi:methionine-S-sulfoxide reductase